MIIIPGVTRADCNACALEIRDCIDGIERTGCPLNAWQSDLLAKALARLTVGFLGLALEAVDRAADPEFWFTDAVSDAFAGGPVVTVAEIRLELDRMISEEA